jgi:maltose O-acetyltransferase
LGDKIALNGLAQKLLSMLKRIFRLLKRISQPKKLNKMIAGGLEIGQRFSFQAGLIIDPCHYWHIKIGDDVIFARNVHILAHDASTKMHLGYTKIGKVKIGNKVFVGARTIILPGVTIGDNSIIGAGSVVTKDIPPNTVASGNPASVLCSIEGYLLKHKNNMKNVPCFGEEYTLKMKPNLKMKMEMNRKMNKRIGYIV